MNAEPMMLTQQYPVVRVMGPRQSDKSTLVQGASLPSTTPLSPSSWVKGHQYGL